jgi:GNAT superfamily N-acetyltransferase
MSPIFDPGQSNLRIDSAFWLEAYDDDGNTVAAHAARLFDWPDTTVVDEIRSLRVFYDDPAPHIADGESVELDGTAVAHIRGRTVYGGALWVRPDYRRRGLTTIMPRISRAYAFTRWDTQFHWSFVEPKTHTFGVPHASGPFHVEDNMPVTLQLQFRGLFPSYLMWMSSEDMLEDVAGIVYQPTLDSSRRMEMPSTNKSLPDRRQGRRSRS